MLHINVYLPPTYLPKVGTYVPKQLGTYNIYLRCVPNTCTRKLYKT